MNKLIELHTDIEARVQTIRAGYPDWLCCMGCDGCCRRLAEIPRLTSNEWDLLREGLSKLPEHDLQAIAEAVENLSNQAARPFVCPMLNQNVGSCRIYDYRPIACRTYGFYVDRDKGVYCKDIEALVAQGHLDDVIWGNQDAVDNQLTKLGKSSDLTEWFEAWKQTWG